MENETIVFFKNTQRYKDFVGETEKFLHSIMNENGVIFPTKIDFLKNPFVADIMKSDYYLKLSYDTDMLTAEVEKAIQEISLGLTYLGKKMHLIPSKELKVVKQVLGNQQIINNNFITDEKLKDLLEDAQKNDCSTFDIQQVLEKNIVIQDFGDKYTFTRKMYGDFEAMNVKNKIICENIVEDFKKFYQNYDYGFLQNDFVCAHYPLTTFSIELKDLFQKLLKNTGGEQKYTDAGNFLYCENNQVECLISSHYEKRYIIIKKSLYDKISLVLDRKRIVKNDITKEEIVRELGDEFYLLLSQAQLEAKKRNDLFPLDLQKYFKVYVESKCMDFCTISKLSGDIDIDARRVNIELYNDKYKDKFDDAVSVVNYDKIRELKKQYYHECLYGNQEIEVNEKSEEISVKNDNSENNINLVKNIEKIDVLVENVSSWKQRFLLGEFTQNLKQEIDAYFKDLKEDLLSKGTTLGAYNHLIDKDFLLLYKKNYL